MIDRWRKHGNQPPQRQPRPRRQRWGQKSGAMPKHNLLEVAFPNLNYHWTDSRNRKLCGICSTAVGDSSSMK